MNSAPPDTPTENKVRHLDHSLVHGIAWTGVARWSTQFLTWATTLFVARVLAPEDFGIFSMAMLYLGLLAVVTEFGLGSAVVVIRDLSEAQVGQLNALSIVLGFAGLGLTALVALPVSKFFHAPPLAGVLVVMGVGFVISSFQSVPSGLLQRDLNYKYLSVVEIAKSLSSCAVMVILAILGARYWTLVAGSLVGAVIASLLILFRRSHSFAMPRYESLRKAVGFGWQVLIGRVSWYGYSNSDFLVAGRVLGQAVLGSYSLAWNLATLPIDKLTALVGNVTPGVYAAAQDDPDSLKRYLLKPIEAISILIFPVMAGLALVAKPAVLVVLGEKWNGAIVPLQLLCAYAAIRAVMPLVAQVLVVVGEAKFVMWVNIWSVIIFPIVFLAASRWGAAGIAAAWILIYPINAVPIYLRTRKRIGLVNAEFFHALWPGLHSTVIMSLAVLGAKMLVSRVSSALLQLIVEILAGILTYTVMLLVFHRHRLSIFQRAFSLLRTNTGA